LNGLDDASNILTSLESINAGANIGYIETIRWLAPDQLMVTIIGTFKNEQLLFIDLNEKEIYGTCIGMYKNFILIFHLLSSYDEKKIQSDARSSIASVLQS